MKNHLSAVAGMAILAYVLCAAVPAFGGDRDYNKDFDVYTDIVYGHKYALAMTMDAVVPKKGGNGAAVVWIVSGGWHSGLFPPWAAFSPDYPYAGFFDCRALLDKGFAVFFVRHGDGSKFPMPEIVDDCRRAIRFLRLNARKYNVDPRPPGHAGRQRRRSFGVDAVHHFRRGRAQPQEFRLDAAAQRPHCNGGGVLPTHGHP